MSGFIGRPPQGPSFRLGVVVRYLAMMRAPMPVDFGLPEGFDPRRHTLELDAQDAPMFKRRIPPPDAFVREVLLDVEREANRREIAARGAAHG